MSSRRIRQHINPLRPALQNIALSPIDVPPGVQVEVELGSAEAYYLFDRARHDPAAFCVGIEIRQEMVSRANKAAVIHGLQDRVVNVFANMRCDLPRLFPHQKIHRFFLNFPDPWLKGRQHKRRVADGDLVDVLVAHLAPGGEVHVNTDIFPIALEAMAAMEEQPRLHNLYEPWRFLRQPLLAAQSRRDLFCVDKGTKVWRLAYGLLPA